MESSTTKRLHLLGTGVMAIPPDEFAEYRLLRPLGESSDSRVYLARDTLLDRLVALKFVHAADRRSLDHFLVEARAAARIQHPNIATLYRVGRVEDGAYLVSEYVQGRPLASVARPVEFPRVLEMAEGLARGLAAAHRRGVLHCDLKPANVLVTDEGQIKIVDFGLARMLLPTAAGADLEDEPERQLVGTPFHIPPEAWRGEELTFRSDIYALGVILFELCAGRGPFHDVPPHLFGHVVTERDAPPLSSRVPDLHPGLAAAVDRCLRRDPRERFATADELLEALDRARPGRRIPLPEGNPYRGLQAFQPEHRALFFGRAGDCLSLVERMRVERFVLVAGDSGIGKSSICLAGVVPAVSDGALGPARTWRIARLVPGRRPLAALANALEPHDAGGAEKLLREDPGGFARKVQRELTDERGVVIFVDQLEELITLGREEAPAMAAALAELAAGYDGIRVLATSRNDFLGPLTSLPSLGELIPRALYLLRGLSEDDLCEAIAGPAAAKGFRFESDGLVRELAAATATALGGLPLLQFMLSQVWEARDRERGIITAAGIDALGGVAGALARHADTVLSGLLPEEREAARRLLLRLATPQLTRTRHSYDELTGGDPASQGALEALIRGRLLVVHEGKSVELAHEALLTAWGTLARWIKEESGHELVRQRVEAAAAEWVRSGRDTEALWGSRRLPETRALDPRLLSETAREFLGKSQQAIASAAWRRRALVAGGIFALVALIAGSRLLRERELDAHVADRLADASAALQKARAEGDSLASARAESFREFDAGRKASGEEKWQRALGLRASTTAAFAEAATSFEDALLLGGNRDDVRAAFADFLAARAAREDRKPEREELLQRLRLYDPAGDRLRAFRADAVLSLATTPPGAKVRVAPVVETDGVRTAGAMRDLGISPVATAHLEPGTYQLSIALEGRPAVDLPLQLDPGEERRIDIDIPSALPSGFAYVPRGRGWFGTSADESVRQFFNTVPLHAIETPAFLIARHETTWAEWIEYLRALPAAERKRRTPHVGGTGLSGQLDLRESSGSFVLALQTGSRVQVLHEGDRLRLPRADRGEQDWLLLPVAGISFHDVRAYADWLSRTGRVPGARPCTEIEWERAARGADDRDFPSGNVLRPADANFDATYGKQGASFGPDEVGSHPTSRSPFGVDDLAGNVWEWVESSLAKGEAVARGGSAWAAANTCRIPNRETPEPSFRAAVLGARICASYPVHPPPPGDSR
ncbi:MAG: protein kinase domain-containing protein [Myxococcales bacterium]